MLRNLSANIILGNIQRKEQKHNFGAKWVLLFHGLKIFLERAGQNVYEQVTIYCMEC